MIYAFDQEQLDKTEDILEKNLIKNGVKIAIVLDMAGHIVAMICIHLQLWRQVILVQSKQWRR